MFAGRLNLIARKGTGQQKAAKKRKDFLRHAFRKLRCDDSRSWKLMPKPCRLPLRVVPRRLLRQRHRLGAPDLAANMAGELADADRLHQRQPGIEAALDEPPHLLECAVLDHREE